MQSPQESLTEIYMGDDKITKDENCLGNENRFELGQQSKFIASLKRDWIRYAC